MESAGKGRRRGAMAAGLPNKHHYGSNETLSVGVTAEGFPPRQVNQARATTHLGQTLIKAHLAGGDNRQPNNRGFSGRFNWMFL